MRGTLYCLILDAYAVRFIPAYAGNTCCYLSRVRHSPVHPRVCGEHRGYNSWDGKGLGSSPRMRGTHLATGASAKTARFIPAYAGNTLNWTGRSWGMPVHPRVCGEHQIIVSNWMLISGSSPRMRGTLPEHRTADVSSRFIPAYAGNTVDEDVLSHADAVHPRVCGEHDGGHMAFAAVGGSSPRMRGTQQVESDSPGLARFIPAYAGNTSSLPP